MALSMEQLRAAFKSEDKSQSRPNNYYPFWLMNTGEQCVVRFLPDGNEDNPQGFVVEKATHSLLINGEEKKVRCFKPESDCPICKVSAAFYKDNDELNGKKYWKKKQHIAQAIIVEDPLPPDKETKATHQGQVRFIALGYQLYNIIKDSFESGELGEIPPYQYIGGCDFIIKKTEQGKYASYAVGSRFARRSSDLTEEQIAVVEEQKIDLITLLPAYTEMTKVESMLEASLNGGGYGETEHVSVPTNNTNPVVPDMVTSSVDDDVFEAVSTESTSSESGDDLDAMLARIRARNGEE